MQWDPHEARERGGEGERGVERERSEKENPKERPTERKKADEEEKPERQRRREWRGKEKRERERAIHYLALTNAERSSESTWPIFCPRNDAQGM